MGPALPLPVVPPAPEARVSTRLLLPTLQPGEAKPKPSPCPQLSPSRALVSAHCAQGHDTDVSLHILLLCKDQLDLARARREPQKCEAARSFFCKSLSRAGEEAWGLCTRSAPHSPAALRPGSVTKVLVPARPSGLGLPRPMLVLDPTGFGSPAAETTLVEDPVSYQAVANAREAPDPPCPLSMCGAPAPSPGRPAAAQAPHAATHRQAVGLEGRLDSVSCWQPKCPGLESGGGERR